MFLTTPFYLFAHGEQVGIMVLASFFYFLFLGLIISFIENYIFKEFSDSKNSLGKLISLNYLTLIISYILFAFILRLTYNLTHSSKFSDELINTINHQELLAEIKVTLIMILYLAFVLLMKYILYKKLVLRNESNKKIFIMIATPNIVCIGLFCILIYNSLVWII